MPHFDHLYSSGQHFTRHSFWRKNPVIPSATTKGLTQPITESNTYF